VAYVGGMKSALFALVALILVGCQTVEPLQAQVPDLVLAQAQTRKAGNLVVTFPAGRYVAAFTKNGATYYRSQSQMTGGASGWMTLNADSGIAVTAAGGHGFFTGGPGFYVLDRPLEIAR
jgi:hypothetical protein